MHLLQQSCHLSSFLPSFLPSFLACLLACLLVIISCGWVILLCHPRNLTRGVHFASQPTTAVFLHSQSSTTTTTTTTKYTRQSRKSPSWCARASPHRDNERLTRLHSWPFWQVQA